MRALIVRRLIELPIAILAVLVLVFLALHTTGDPVEMLVPPQATEQDKTRVRQAYGLDQPLPIQLGAFVSKAVRGDFGNSFFKGKPALDLVLERVPASLELALLSTLIAVLVGIPLGIVGAARQGSWIDQAAMLVALVGQSMASFWLALMLILVFAVRLRWLPVSGNQSAGAIVLPAVALSAYLIALLARLSRSGMLEVLGEDYMRTARAKGLPGRLVLLRHGLRNTLIPLVTVMGLSLGWQLGGALVIEVVFAWPGLGSLLLEAVLLRDQGVVLAGVTLLALVFIGINTAVDVLYGFLDPRIRVGGSNA